MKIIIRPEFDPLNELDLTERLVSAIAEELWRAYGGNEQFNWLEAELHLQRVMREVREEDGDTRVLRLSGAIEKPASGADAPNPGRQDSRSQTGRRERQAAQRVRRAAPVRTTASVIEA